MFGGGVGGTVEGAPELDFELFLGAVVVVLDPVAGGAVPELVVAAVATLEPSPAPLFKTAYQTFSKPCPLAWPFLASPEKV